MDGDLFAAARTAIAASLRGKENSAPAIVDDEALSKVGVIINPRSGRGRGKGVALSEALKAGGTTADVAVLSAFADLFPALQRMAANQVQTLYISSGDGTVQAIQTWLAESGQFKTLPRLCLLPHGTTNMTAADLGYRRTSISDQVAAINANTVAETKQRSTIRIVNPKGRGPLHGMFFGTGAVAEATRYCQVAFNDKGVGGNWATFATLASVAAKSIFLRANPHDPNRFDKPYPMRVETDGTRLCDGPQLLMLATTLDKLILGAKPFWGGTGAGPLRTTIMPYPVPSIPRWILPIMYGSEQRNVPAGAISQSCKICSVTSPTRFVIDGEFYDAPDAEPLRLEAGPQLDYLLA
jgi:diacylglycerol kinase (ATP)